LVLLALLICFSSSIEVPKLEDGFVITPFGIRRKECVIEVESDSHVVPLANGDLQITASSGKISRHTPPQHCGDDIEQIRLNHLKKREFGTPLLGGWLDYGGWYPPPSQSTLNSFTSTYVVPGNPPSQDGQVLFYFIGMQDNDAPGYVNIIQPVLTWGNGYNQWYVKSWACCPSNITVSSPPVFGLVPGSKVGGVIKRFSASTWTIDSSFNGQHTVLNAQVGDYNYNWADVTLEVYSITGCQDFAPGQAYFNALILKDVQNQVLSPQWTFTPQSMCGGVIQQTAPTSIYIQHSNK